MKQILLILSLCAGEMSCSRQHPVTEQDCRILVENVNQMMTKYDLNHDNRIDRNEWGQLSRDMFEMLKKSAEQDDETIEVENDQYFEDADLNRDGFIEVWEIARYRTRDPFIMKSCLRPGEFRPEPQQIPSPLR